MWSPTGSVPSLQSMCMADVFRKTANFYLVSISTGTNALDVWHIFASLIFTDTLFSSHWLTLRIEWPAPLFSGSHFGSLRFISSGLYISSTLTLTFWPLWSSLTTKHALLMFQPSHGATDVLLGPFIHSCTQSTNIKHLQCSKPYPSWAWACKVDKNPALHSNDMCTLLR